MSAAGADTVHADADRLEQALQNLAANAIRHSQTGDRVTLSVGRSTANRSCCACATPAKGSPAEHLPRVFDRFYKADASRGGGGSGLGLSIVKAIVERHGGTITVTSDPGRETVFEIRLPR